ncbi:MAG: hypothetical protein AAFN94_08245 [Pseudomonadota bacterium]
MQDFITTCTADDFDPLVGDAFMLTAADTAFEIKLLGVKRLGAGSKRDRPVVIDGVELPAREAFALSFSGPVDRGFQQGIFALTHPATGELHLMLTCFDADADARFYEAVFS